MDLQYFLEFAATNNLRIAAGSHGCIQYMSTGGDCPLEIKKKRIFLREFL
jgi:hypothetical protein